MLKTFIGSFIVSFAISYPIFKARAEAKAEEEKRAFANLPSEVLLQYVLIDPFANAEYQGLRKVMTKEKATEIAINHMLINNGLIGYRKTEL